MKPNQSNQALAFVFAVFAMLTLVAGCGQSEPEKPKGGTYYEGPMKPKSAGAGGG